VNDTPVNVVVLGEAEVVVGQGGDEDDGLDLVEAPDPLLPLGPLTADVEQAERQALPTGSYVKTTVSGNRRQSPRRRLAYRPEQC